MLEELIIGLQLESSPARRQPEGRDRAAELTVAKNVAKPADMRLIPATTSDKKPARTRVLRRRQTSTDELWPTQKPLRATSCGFDSHLRHPVFLDNIGILKEAATRLRSLSLVFVCRNATQLQPGHNQHENLRPRTAEVEIASSDALSTLSQHPLECPVSVGAGRNDACPAHISLRRRVVS